MISSLMLGRILQTNYKKIEFLFMPYWHRRGHYMGIETPYIIRGMYIPKNIFRLNYIVKLCSIKLACSIHSIKTTLMYNSGF